MLTHNQYFTSTKDFSVGDLFLDSKGQAFCYIVEIFQPRKTTQYRYELKYFNHVFRDLRYDKLHINTHDLKECIKWQCWKHIRVAK